LQNIIETINGRLICGDESAYVKSGKVIVVAMQADKMDTFVEDGDFVIVGNRKDVQIRAIELNASCLILIRNSEIDSEVLEKAIEKNCIIISCPHDTFTLTKLISQSISISDIMTSKNIVLISMDDYISDIKLKMLQTRYRSYPVIDDNNVIKGFISRYHLISSRKKKVILVDHNEKSLSVDGIEEAEILEIIDHHRFGDLQTRHPINVRLEPVGSTATMVAATFFDNAIRPAKQIAGILCAAIISDTMNFKSPTTVFKDKLIAEKLAEIANIDINKFAVEMIKESSSIHGKTIKDLFGEDFKEFNLGSQKLAISQIKTMDVNCVDDVMDEIIKYMKILCETNHYKLVMLVITDIIKEGSKVIALGESVPILEKAFNVKLVNNITFLSGVVSRKKQIIPELSNYI
jgi:manganese-dependent inorganic pyrophosphatase